MSDSAFFTSLMMMIAKCTEDLNGVFEFFDLGGISNSLSFDTSIFWGEQKPWIHVKHDLFESSPRDFHLLIDIVSMRIACGDLKCPFGGGPYWYRQWFQGSYEDPDSGSSFTNEFHDYMEEIHDLATEHQVEFGSEDHIRTAVGLAPQSQEEEDDEEEEDVFVFNDTKEGPRAPAQQNGLERLGTRLLHKVCPLRMLRDTIEQILGRCREEGETETSTHGDSFSDLESEEP